MTGVSVTDPLLGSLSAPTGDSTNPGTLDVGETWVYTGSYTVQQSDIDNNGGGDGDIDNTATVNCSELSAESDSAAVPVSGSPSYSIIKEVTDVDGGGPLAHASEAGDVIDYRISVENTGNTSLTGLTLDDSLLGTLTVSSGDTTNPNVLDVNETWVYIGSYTVIQSDIDNNGGGDGDIDNTATVDCNELDAETDSAAVILDQNASYITTKTVTDVDGGGPSAHANEAGDVITYQISVENTGNTSLTGVTVNDPLLGALFTPTGDNTNPGILDVGETWVYTGSYTVTQSDLDNNGGGDGDIDNTATTDCNELDAETDSVAVILDQNASYTITKTVTDVDGGGSSAHANAAGDVITYQISVVNTGNTSLTGISVNDPLLGSLSGPTGDSTNVGTWMWPKHGFTPAPTQWCSRILTIMAAATAILTIPSPWTAMNWMLNPTVQRSFWTRMHHMSLQRRLPTWMVAAQPLMSMPLVTSSLTR